MADEAAHLAAVVVLLEAAGAEPMTLQQIKDASPLPPYYTEVTVSQRLGSGPRRATAGATSTQWRILARAVAKRYANAQEMRRRAAALHEAKLTVDGEAFHVERSISDDPIAPDDGWWSGVSEFGY